jgi:hypothetical protein
MTDELLLPRKWVFRAHGRQVIFVKKSNESGEHVLMKAILWALYLPSYSDLTVEVAVGDRYKPDLVALAADGAPRFWGEAGEVRPEKIRSLARRYRGTHFALAKWDARLAPTAGLVTQALAGLKRTASFDLISVPADSAERFLDENGVLRISHRDVEWIRIGQS